MIVFPVACRQHLRIRAFSIGDIYLLNCLINYISCHHDRILLLQSYCSWYRLVFHTRIPLRFNDKNSIGRCEIEAKVKVSVVFRWSDGQKYYYPKAPVPVVMMRTGIFKSADENSSRIFCRRPRLTSPSILSKVMLAASRYFSIRSNVFVQQENTILWGRWISFSTQWPSVDDEPFGFR